MMVIIKTITGDIERLFNAKVSLHTDWGILEVRYTDRRSSEERLRTYILRNLISYETRMQESNEEESNASQNDGE